MKNLLMKLIEFLIPTIPQRIIWTAKQGIYSNANGISEEDLIWYIAKTYSASDVLLKVVIKALALLPVIASFSLPLPFLPGDIGTPIRWWLLGFVIYLVTTLIMHYSFVFLKFENRSKKIEDYLQRYDKSKLVSWQLERHRLLKDEWERITNKSILSKLYE